VTHAGYQTDLAYIHDAGYGRFARSAAGVLLKLLKKSGKRGLVVDLGCGSGILAEQVVAAGHGVLGIDISEPMIALAQRRVPRAEFRAESFVTAEIPPCLAVVSIGECINYLFDPANTRRALAGLLRRIHGALLPGGFLMFDVAGPGRIRNGSQTIYHESNGWAVGVVATEKGRRLTRRITSFRRVGRNYRREYAEHLQQLYSADEMLAMLRAAGFRARRVPGYGALHFPRGLTGFLARKS
jgi:SAM-dependent methyltransferase